MTKKEMKLFLEDLQKVREMLTPEQAAQVPNLFPKIKEGKEIKKGDRVNVDGHVLEAREDIKDPKEKDIKRNNKLGTPQPKSQSPRPKEDKRP